MLTDGAGVQSRAGIEPRRDATAEGGPRLSRTWPPGGRMGGRGRGRFPEGGGVPVKADGGLQQGETFSGGF
jgi:hypothetical protein